jgi:PsbP
MRQLARIAAFAVALSTAVLPAQAGDVLFRDEQYLFRLLYPDTWSQVSTLGRHVRVSVTSQKGSGLANCQVIVRPAPDLEHMSRAEIEVLTTGLFTREVMAEFISGFLPGVEVVQAGEYKLDNRPSGFALASTTYQAAGVRVDATLIFVVTFTRLGMYAITCGSSNDRFERDYPELMRIITSFYFEDEGM